MEMAPRLLARNTLTGEHMENNIGETLPITISEQNNSLNKLARELVREAILRCGSIDLRAAQSGRSDNREANDKNSCSLPAR
jgi:hypothetical protein